LVDDRKTDIASYLIRPGQTIRFKEGIHKVIRDNMEQNASHNVPGWLEWNPAQLTAKVVALPTPEDVPYEVNLNLIIEFYRRSAPDGCNSSVRHSVRATCYSERYFAENLPSC